MVFPYPPPSATNFSRGLFLCGYSPARRRPFLSSAGKFWSRPLPPCPPLTPGTPFFWFPARQPRSPGGLRILHESPPTLRPSGSVSFCAGRSIDTLRILRQREQLGVNVGGTTIGSSEFFSEFCLKMSAKEVLITARKPNCVSAQGACSRELPQPKLSPASRICGALGARLVQDEIGLGIALGVVAPVVEELLVEAFLRGGLQKPRRDDLVGVDVVDRAAEPGGFRNW